MKQVKQMKYRKVLYKGILHDGSEVVVDLDGAHKGPDMVRDGVRIFPVRFKDGRELLFKHRDQTELHDPIPPSEVAARTRFNVGGELGPAASVNL